MYVDVTQASSVPYSILFTLALTITQIYTLFASEAILRHLHKGKKLKIPTITCRPSLTIYILGFLYHGY